MKKIHIVGGPGCGKTYISHALSKRLNIVVYSLDELYWCTGNNNYNIQSDPKIRDGILLQITRNKEWIIEGVYGGWTEPSFKESDIIIILQPNNKIVRSWRITKRFVKRKLGAEKNKKRETWKSFFELFRWSWRYYQNEFPAIYKQIQKYKYKTIKITKSQITVDEIMDM